MAGAEKKKQWKWPIILVVVLVTAGALGIMFRGVNRKISDATVGNLSGTVSMVAVTADGLMKEDAQALKLIVEKAVEKEDMKAWFNDFCGTNGMTGVAMTKPGEKTEVAGSGTDIPLDSLEFSEETVIDDVFMCGSYVNSDGKWAYALSCPIKDGKEYIGDLIAEYEWGHIYQSMTTSLYEDDTSLLVYDNLTDRVVVQPEESREAVGELKDLDDFITLTGTDSKTEKENIRNDLENRFAHLVERNVNGVEYMAYIWPVNQGTTYLLGMVPVESIMKEIPIVKQSVFFVGGIILISCLFVGIIFAVFSYNEKKEHEKLDAEREKYSKELEQALIKAEKANAAKTVFLSNMSHDMRTPLNGITGLLKIEESHPNDQKLIRENREKMKISADYLLSLVNDLLQMSRMEEGDIVLGHEPVDIRELSMDIVTLIGERAAEKSISLTYDQNETDLSAPYVYTSLLHIRQLFLNIYGNCIKYNKTGGNINTSFRCLDKKDDKTVTYQWIISDTGIGMSKAFQEHIFEPFSQEHTDARSVYNGAGLGMAIVKKIVDAMGGTVEVTSTEGVGSTFTVTIPFEIASEKDVQAARKKEEPSEKYSIRGCHLLMAEDNELNAEIAETLLRDQGAVITTVKDGRAAVKAFEENPPGTFDGILMDIMMPVMNGLLATRAIRSVDREDAKTIPIIAMTANVFEEDEKQCFAAGMNAYLPKPLQIEKMVEVIAKTSKHSSETV